MRHRKAGYKLGRTTAHRTATLRNLACSLFEHGQITTTIPRAKAVQPMVEKIITTAKKGGRHARRQVIATLGWDRPGFEWLWQPNENAVKADETLKPIAERAQAMADRASKFFDIPKASEVELNRYGEVRKAPKIVKHIFDNVAPRFRDRAGGYTRVVKLGRHRIGDGGELCVIQFVGAEDGPEIGGTPSTRRRIADRRTAFAAKTRKAAPAGAGQANPA
ncbi:MAG: 50S ribosomal protein L17 [Phycisphaeraceae bacterium]|nr:50S ribosomal protein L17 [Phycisphaeraceae bacterium]